MTDKAITIGQDLNGLNFRRSLCKRIIKTLDHLPKGTPNKLSAMGIYKAQLAEIDRRITKITGTPPPNVIGLKTAILFGEAKPVGGN